MTTDFDGTFSLLNSLTFTFTFSGDLFDPGESFYIGPFKTSGNVSHWPGKSNVGSEAISSVILYIIDPAILTLFSDGFQTLDFYSRIGSMNILDAKLVANGNFTPSPVPLPPAVWLLGSGLVALWSRRKKSKV